VTTSERFDRLVEPAQWQSRQSREESAMTDHERKQLLDALMYYCPMDLRAKVMREVPQAYNAYCGTTIVEVRHTSDGRVA
jgi:hypothetical protein